MKDEVFNNVLEVFRKVLENDKLELKPTYTAYDVDGWDSLTHIMLVVEIEKHFNISFLSDEITSWKNIGEMIECIKRRLSDN